MFLSTILSPPIYLLVTQQSISSCFILQPLPTQDKLSIAYKQDPDINFLSAMCKALRIKYEILAKRKHKGLLVEKFHWFLNKVVTIVVEDRGTNDIFVAAGAAAGYAWNSSHIDGTNILLSVPAIGRELRFPLDVDISDLPALVSNNADSAVSYLRLRISIVTSPLPS